METSTEQPRNTDSNKVIKENKVMTQEIWKMSILYPKTSKEFYHHIKSRKSIINRRCSIKITVLKNFIIFTEKIPLSIFFNKNAGPHACNVIKRRLTPVQVFSWQYCKIFKNSYFEEHLWTSASKSFSFYVSLSIFLHEQKM